MIVDSTNPRIMADNIRELAKNGGGGGSDLPEVTSADNGKVLGVVEGSWNKMDAPSGGIDYSTTEQNTGRKWIDGKDIFQKTIVLESTVLVKTSWISTGIASGDILTVLNMEILDGNNNPMTGVSLAIIDGYINLISYSSAGLGVKTFTIRYVKATTTETKKRKTTKGEN